MGLILRSTTEIGNCIKVKIFPEKNTSELFLSSAAHTDDITCTGENILLHATARVWLWNLIDFLISRQSEGD